MRVVLRLAHKRPIETYVAGGKYSHAAGEEVDLPDWEALALIGKGYAIPVAERATQKAVKTRRETRKRR